MYRQSSSGLVALRSDRAVTAQFKQQLAKRCCISVDGDDLLVQLELDCSEECDAQNGFSRGDFEGCITQHAQMEDIICSAEISRDY